MEGVDPGVLAKMPLAEAVLTVWRYVASEERLQTLFDRHRGRSYERSISFATLVRLIADALVEHGGSGNQSFSRADEAGELEATPRAVYGKLGRLPVGLSVAFLSELSAASRELFPSEASREPPAGLEGFAVVTIDGKAVKRVARRLKPIRSAPGGVVGGKALVATERSAGLVVAMAADPDGDANDARLVPDLLPRVRERFNTPVLWVADRAYCLPLQLSRFAAQGDAFVLRYNAKSVFTRDASHPLTESTDDEDRAITDERGWLGREKNKHRRYVRRVTLHREGSDDVAVVTDQMEAPAITLLELYRERWGIERMFQQVTEVFGLEKLIGGRPEATIFQLAFCLLLYNQTQLIRSYVVKHQELEEENVSLEQLFTDARRQLTAWAVVLGNIDLPKRSAAQTRRRLGALLRNQWSDRWVKAIRRPSKPPDRKPKQVHASAYRLLNPAAG